MTKNVNKKTQIYGKKKHLRQCFITFNGIPSVVVAVVLLKDTIISKAHKNLIT